MNNEAHPTPKKIAAVKELAELFTRARGLYLADFTGLNVEQANKLRSNFRNQNATYRVYKNTLIRHACQEAGYNDLIPHLEGPTAIAVSFDDPVIPVKIISDFVKDLDKEVLIIKAGVLEKTYVDAQQVKIIKNIPPREVLLAQIIASIQAPLANFVGVLNEVLRSFVAVLQAMIDKKKAAGEDHSQESDVKTAAEEAVQSTEADTPQNPPEQSGEEKSSQTGSNPENTE